MMTPQAASLLSRAHDLAERRYSGAWDMQPARLIDALHVIESERAILHAKDHPRN